MVGRRTTVERSIICLPGIVILHIKLQKVSLSVSLSVQLAERPATLSTNLHIESPTNFFPLQPFEFYSKFNKKIKTSPALHVRSFCTMCKRVKRLDNLSYQHSVLGLIRGISITMWKDLIVAKLATFVGNLLVSARSSPSGPRWWSVVVLGNNYLRKWVSKAHRHTRNHGYLRGTHTQEKRARNFPTTCFWPLEASTDFIEIESQAGTNVIA